MEINEIMKPIITLGLTAIATMGLIVASTRDDMQQPKILANAGTTSYACASIHFGMEDADLSGKASSYGSTWDGDISGYEFGHGSGITIETCNIVEGKAQWLYTGYVYKVGKTKKSAQCDHGAKMGTATSDCNVVWCFAETIIGCDLYVKGWSGASPTVSVNGSEPVSVEEDQVIAGTFESADIEYQKIHFDFQATYELNVLFRGRSILGDIALRIS